MAVEVADDRILSRVVGSYGRLDLLCLDLCRYRDYAEGRALRFAEGFESRTSDMGRSFS